MSAGYPSSQLPSAPKTIPIIDATSSSTTLPAATEVVASTFTYPDGTPIAVPTAITSELTSTSLPSVPLTTPTLATPLPSAPLQDTIPKIPPPPAPSHHHLYKEENLLLSEGISHIPQPPLPPPVYRYPHSRIRPYVKYGSVGQHLSFTLVLKQYVPEWTEGMILPQGWIGWGAAKVGQAKDTVTGWVGEKAFQTKEAVKGSAYQAKEAAVETGQWVEEKAFQAGAAVKGTAYQAKEAAVETGQWMEDKAFQAGAAVKGTAYQAKEAAVETGQWVEEKAAQAKEAAVETGHWVGEKAAVAKENVVPAVVSAAQVTKEVAKETGEWVGEKAEQAKETLAPAMHVAKEKAIETAVAAKENLPGAMETAKEVAKETGGMLASAASTALHAGAQFTDWAVHKAEELETAAMATGKSLLGMAEHAVESLRTTFHELHPEGWQEGVIPIPPPAPAVYRYPLARVRPYVKYGRNMRNVAFTIVILSVVPRVEEGVSSEQFLQKEFVETKEFYSTTSVATLGSGPSLSSTLSSYTTDSSNLKGGVSTHHATQKERLPSFITPEALPQK